MSGIDYVKEELEGLLRDTKKEVRDLEDKLRDLEDELVSLKSLYKETNRSLESARDKVIDYWFKLYELGER